MDLQTTILSGLIPNSLGEKAATDAAFIEAVGLKLTADHFTGHSRYLFETISKQVARKSIIDREILESYLSVSPYSEEEKTQVRILFATCREATVDLDKLRTIIPTFIEQQDVKLFGNVLTDTVRILTEGLHIGKADLKGLKEAKGYLIKNIASIRGALGANAVQGSVQDSDGSFWERYRKEKDNPTFGIKSGIREIDGVTHGIKPGELFTLAGYSKDGKSIVLRTIAYNAMLSGRNVVLATLEMSYQEILNSILSMHSTHPKFGDPRGISTEVISNHLMSPDQEERLKEVSKDLSNNPEYGIFYLLELPSGSTVADLNQSLLYVNSQFHIDMLVMDYASLLKSTFSKATPTFEITEVYQALKALSRSFDGRGLAIWNGHQTSTKAKEDALKSEGKRYTIGFCADAIEAVRSSDAVFWVLRYEELITAKEIKMGLAYFRRGKIIPDFHVMEYYECSKVENMGPIASSGFGSGKPSTPPPGAEVFEL